jgi:glyoxylase I family protein
MIRGIHHTSFSTNSLEAMVRFYRDLLGLEQIASSSWGKGTEIADRVTSLTDSEAEVVLLRAGNAFIEIFHYLNPKGADPEPNRQACDVGVRHVCFDVVDIDREYERLAAAGVRFHCAPAAFGSVKCTYGRDPDGNIFELQEVLNPASPLHPSHLRLLEGRRADEPRAETAA